MQSADVLGNRPAPGNGKRQKERVEPGVVKTLSDVATGGQEHSLLVLGNGRQTSDQRLSVLGPHSAAKDDKIANLRRQLGGEAVEVLVAFGQHQGRTALPNGLNHFIADRPIALLVGNEIGVQVLKLDSHIWIGRCQRTKGRGANQHGVLKRMGCRLRLRVNLVAHGPALHEDDRMMAVLACNSGREAQYKSCLGPAYNLLEALRRKMVAFVNHDLSVIGYAIADNALAHQALNDGHVQSAGRSPLAGAYPANPFGRQIEKRRQSLDPLLEQLATMNED